MPRLTKVHLAIAVGLVASCAITAGCSSGSASPTITGSEAPAPGSQDGVRSVSDTDYEQLALAVDTSQIALATLAKDPARKASPEVLGIASQTLTTLGPEAVQLRKSLVTAGDAATSDHHKAAVDDAGVAKLQNLTGPAFDSAWARDMYVLNEQVIAAAVTELNVGEDKQTRAMAREKIDYASAQNGQLRRLTGAN